MSKKHELFRVLTIGVLLIMVLRSLEWLVNPGAEATASRYALNIGTIVACGLTAWATWKPSAGAIKVLQRTLVAALATDAHAAYSGDPACKSID